MTPLIERLVELRRHLDHLEELRPQVRGVAELERDPQFSDDISEVLERLPGFRNILVHDYVALDMERVVEALDELGPIRRFLSILSEA